MVSGKNGNPKSVDKKARARSSCMGKKVPSSRGRCALFSVASYTPISSGILSPSLSLAGATWQWHWPDFLSPSLSPSALALF